MLFSPPSPNRQVLKHCVALTFQFTSGLYIVTLIYWTLIFHLTVCLSRIKTHFFAKTCLTSSIVYIYIYIKIYIYMCVYIYIYTHIHIYKHIYIYIYTFKHIYFFLFFLLYHLITVNLIYHNIISVYTKLVTRMVELVSTETLGPPIKPKCNFWELNKPVQH